MRTMPAAHSSRRWAAPALLIPLLAVLLAPSLLTAAALSAAQQRGATVSLRAKWEGTSTLLEAAEFLADEGLLKFWSFANAVDSGEILRGSGSCWARIVQRAAAELSSELAQVLHTYLALRYHSPRLEMFRSLMPPAAEGECCWVQMGSRNFTLADGLREAILSAAAAGDSEHLYSFDHLHSGREGAEGLPSVVLYGAPGTRCFGSMHAQLAQLAQEGAVLYALRPHLARSCAAEAREGMADCLQLGTGEALPLPGYGVELAIKNMEYKAMDDSEVKSKAQFSQAAQDMAEGEVVEGFLFGQLAKRKPEAQADLAAFRDFLLARQTSAEEETLKVWDLKDLGLQAVQRVASSSDPLRLLADISQNFPARATSLSRLEVDGTLRAEVKRIQQVLPSGTNFLLLNGLMVDVDTLELYSLAERVRHDARLSQRLAAAGIPPSAIRALMAIRPALAQEDGGDVRVDLGKSAPVKFLNNLEKDRMYSGWHTSLQTLMMPSFGGQMMPVARNAFTAVYVIDPSSKASLGACGSILSFYTRGMPLRLGVMLLPEAAVLQAAKEAGGQGPPARILPWDSTGVAERVARAFHMLFKTFGPKTAFQFLAGLGSNEDDSDMYGEDYNEDEYEDSEGGDGSLSWEEVASVFAELWTSSGASATTKKGRLAAKLSGEAALGQLQEGTGHAEGVSEEVLATARHAVARGVLPGPLGVRLWFNGLMSDDASPQALFGTLQMEMQTVQMQVYRGQLTDGSDVAAAILRNAGAVPRYNPAILSKGGGDESSSSPENGGVRDVNLPTDPELLGLLEYISYKGKLNDTKQVTHWVMADLGTEEGRSLALQSVLYAEDKKAAVSRISLIHCPAGEATAFSGLAVLVHAAAALGRGTTESGAASLTFLQELLGAAGEAARKQVSTATAISDEGGFQLAFGLAENSGLDTAALKSEMARSAQAAAAIASGICSILFDGSADDSEAGEAAAAGGQAGRARPAAVVTNGRLVPNHGLLVGGLSADDFQLMGMYAAKVQAAGKVATALKPKKSKEEEPGEPTLTPRLASDAVMAASSLLRRLGLRDDMRTDENSLRLAEVVGTLQSKHGALLAADPPAPSSSLEVVAVVDPLTPGAQKLVSMLLFLRESFAPRMRVWLNPRLDLSELPLKSFFRFALPTITAREGCGEGEEMPGAPQAAFSGLPQKKILTLNVHSPEAWLVEPVRALYDTDNLLLADLPEGESTVYVDYELEALMITGSCIDISATTREQMTPRGVQLHLGNALHPHVVDTLVMSNLGYFQLKAAPGVWSLSLAPGASSALYSVNSSTGISEEGSMQTASSTDATSVVVSSMNGKHMFLKLKKDPAHMKDDVLTFNATAPSDALPASNPSTGPSKASGGGTGLWGKLTSMLGSAAAPAKPAGSDLETINVFTVASGHMYERLQKIMILSVLKHTSNPVKFWFIKNYMSPQMKAFLPHFASVYGFEYELVTYKWPRWLHKQTEKQRLIWAYKILFLDVLFPLSLKKVIFVDADQIIRADLRELIDMDLEGAPYAYTPFCDNNKDMDGYRFWNTGFWKDHLRGRPYHISALYVVDLQQFRKKAAGDQLRIIYDSLSKDPNSLANLDQDLPNYAQHQVKIKSLPQEWLWCESWCGNATKTAAKTIDLCNNPMTKEPKLQGARRIVTEWPGFDEEVQAFTAKVEILLEGDEDEGEEGAAAMPPSGPSGGQEHPEGDGEQEGASQPAEARNHDGSEL
mmetsp:Transcript_11957/g.33653  ORF Transcript_11957/g.33653 Transcript_11957/m.33653 type:complete len:1727 (-) Transcript_11957:508-5688(-)